MRKLIMWNMVTLDGLFEGTRSWDIDWHEVGWGEELERLSIEQLEAADLLLFGRVTYQGMASYWSTASGEVADLMNAIPKIVFSSTLERADWSSTRLVRARAEDEVPELKRQAGRDILVFGSADLSAPLLRRGLFDEVRLGVNPIILGSGRPLFQASPERLRLRLLEAKPLATGCVILRYAPQPQEPPDRE